jgi:TetR/AcrR family transcriptional regulator, cholesterol catabolism regulator
VNWTHRWFKPADRQGTAEQTIETFTAIFFEGFCRKPG